MRYCVPTSLALWVPILTYCSIAAALARHACGPRGASNKGRKHFDLRSNKVEGTRLFWSSPHWESNTMERWKISLMFISRRATSPTTYFTYIHLKVLGLGNMAKA
ncbi:hypothetical protein F4779DRAFT_600927, partial [Xylariaceae sp. FL0662B]